MMNGTVTPWSVVVVATSDGGLFGSYAFSEPSVDMYWKAYDAGSLHCLSLAVAWHVHGWICGPEKTGPPFGWLVITTVAVWPLARATSEFGPRRIPVTSPW